MYPYLRQRCEFDIIAHSQFRFLKQKQKEYKEAEDPQKIKQYTLNKYINIKKKNNANINNRKNNDKNDKANAIAKVKMQECPT